MLLKFIAAVKLVNDWEDARPHYPTKIHCHCVCALANTQRHSGR